MSDIDTRVVSENTHPYASFCRSFDGLEKFLVRGVESEGERRVDDTPLDMDTEVDLQHVLLAKDYPTSRSAQR